MFINCLPEAAVSKVHVFADDVVFYKQIKDRNDCAIIQNDLPYKNIGGRWPCYSKRVKLYTSPGQEEPITTQYMLSDCFTFERNCMTN